METKSVKVFVNFLRVPPPLTQGQEANMRLFLFDSWYDRYHGTINLVQVGLMRMRTALLCHKHLSPLLGRGWCPDWQQESSCSFLEDWKGIQS